MRGSKYVNRKISVNRSPDYSAVNNIKKTPVGPRSYEQKIDWSYSGFGSSLFVLLMDGLNRLSPSLASVMLGGGSKKKNA